MLPNVLISSAGRRVALLKLFRDAVAARRPGAWVGATDCGTSAPAGFVADKFWRVPRCSDPAFAGRTLGICIDNGIGLVIPANDNELPVYAAWRARFEAAGVTVGISGPRTIEIARDKNRTHEWLVAHGFPTVRQALPADVLATAGEWVYPLIAKPHDGSASAGVRRIANAADLRRLAAECPGHIVQEMAQGREYTVNLYVNRAGKCVCAVPHWRLEVRAGEVSKGIAVKDAALIDLCRRVAEALPESRGVLNVQCFSDGDRIAIIEVNARFGGGYPLAHRAGAHFTHWLLDEQEGREIPAFDGWEDNLAMLRYDDAVFVPGAQVIGG